MPCESFGYDHDQMVEIKTGIGKGGVLFPSKGQRKFTTARFAPSAALAPFVEHFWTVALPIEQLHSNTLLISALTEKPTAPQ